MLAKKTLQDLFVQGVVREFSDGDNKIEIYFKKLNSFESENAFKKANAVRARVLSVKFKDESDEDKLPFYSEVYELGDSVEDIADLILADTVADIYLKCEQRIAEQDEWKTDGLIQGLFDSWSDGLSDEYALEKTDESVAVFDQLQEFSAQVKKAADAELERDKRDLVKKPLSKLQELLVGKMIEIEANRKWVLEYNKWEVFFSARDVEDHSIKVFPNREFLDEIDDKFFSQLLTAYKTILVDDVSLKS